MRWPWKRKLDDRPHMELDYGPCIDAPPISQLGRLPRVDDARPVIYFRDDA